MLRRCMCSVHAGPKPNVDHRNHFGESLTFDELTRPKVEYLLTDLNSQTLQALQQSFIRTSINFHQQKALERLALTDKSCTESLG